MLRQFLTAVLIFSILGQNMLFAGTPDSPSSPDRPVTLAQYQTRARQDAADAPWVKEEGAHILAIGGVAAGVVILQHFRHKLAMHSMSMQYQQRLNRLSQYRREEIITSRREISRLQKEAAEKEFENRGLKKYIRSLEKQQDAAAAKQIQLNRYIGQQAAQNQRLAYQAAEWAEWENFLPSANASFDKTARKIAQKLLDGTPLSKAEIDLLTEGMETETAQKIIERLNVMKRFPPTADGGQMASGTLNAIPRFYPEKVPFRTVLYLKNILKEMKGLIGMSVAMAVLLNHQNAQAQTWEGRLNRNFNLFLEATPQELAEIEQLGLSQLCIDGAEAIHQMARMPQEQQRMLQSAFGSDEAHREQIRQLRTQSAY